MQLILTSPGLLPKAASRTPPTSIVFILQVYLNISIHLLLRNMLLIFKRKLRRPKGRRGFP